MWPLLIVIEESFHKANLLYSPAIPTIIHYLICLHYDYSATCDANLPNHDKTYCVEKRLIWLNVFSNEIIANAFRMFKCLKFWGQTSSLVKRHVNNKREDRDRERNRNNNRLSRNDRLCWLLKRNWKMHKRKACNLKINIEVVLNRSN